MGQETDEFRAAVEAGLQAELGCSEPEAERVAETVASARAAGDVPDWSPSFLVAKLTDAPDEYSVPEKWNWLLDYVGGSTDRSAYRFDD